MLSDTFRKAVRAFRSTEKQDFTPLKILGYKVKAEKYYYEVKPGPGLTTVARFAYKWKRNVIIQVPHCLNETHSLSVGEILFERLEARGLWFTVASRSVLDPAHRLDCHYNAATIGLAHDVDQFVSVHGFRGKDDLVLSSGTLIPSMRSLLLYEQLHKALDNVYLYPYHIDRLGGTTNLQGQILRMLGYPESFIHLELGMKLRKDIKYIDTCGALFSLAVASGLDKQVDYRHKELLDLHGQWALGLGVKARRMLGHEGILRVLGAEDIDKPKAVANKLGVKPTEINHYLKDV
jgi:hypothetical protein